MKKFFPFLFANTFPLFLAAQNAPVIEWQKSLGGSATEQATDVYPFAGGNILAAGYTISSDGDVSFLHSTCCYDTWLCLLDSTGNLTWEHSYGGTNSEQNEHLLFTHNGNCWMVSQTFSADGDVNFNHGFGDIWLVRLDSSYNIASQFSYGGNKTEGVARIIETSGHEIVIAGSACSKDGDVSAHYGSTSKSDIWILWCDSNGNLLHEKNYGGVKDDFARSIIETTDGGFLVIGYTLSDDWDVSFNHGDGDAWALKIDSSGIIEWERTLGGSGTDNGVDVIQTADNGFMVLCVTASADGDVTGLHGLSDSWLVELDASGNLVWQKCFGGSSSEFSHSIFADGDRTWCMGYTQSSDGDVTGLHGSDDAWLYQVDSSGNLVSQQCYGGTSPDHGYIFKTVASGGWLMIANSWSNDGDVSGHHGDFAAADYWIVKFKEDLPTFSDSIAAPASLSVFPNPAADIAVIQFSFMENTRADLLLLDMQGREIKKVADGNFESGNHQLSLDRAELLPGVYFLYLKTISGTEIQKVILQ